MYNRVIADPKTQALLLAQEKAELDHLSALGCATEEGIQIGKLEGIQIGEQKGIQIGKLEGIQIGEQKGIQIGEQKGKLEAARAFIQEGVPVDMIARCTGLSISEVEMLRK
jgi:flagellar biosynthesis/type III secretory pathway protein FliH